jgi:hypothetical protein
MENIPNDAEVNGLKTLKTSYEKTPSWNEIANNAADFQGLIKQDTIVQY